MGDSVKEADDCMKEHVDNYNTSRRRRRRRGGSSSSSSSNSSAVVVMCTDNRVLL